MATKQQKISNRKRILLQNKMSTRADWLVRSNAKFQPCMNFYFYLYNKKISHDFLLTLKNWINSTKNVLLWKFTTTKNANYVDWIDLNAEHPMFTHVNTKLTRNEIKENKVFSLIATFFVHCASFAYNYKLLWEFIETPVNGMIRNCCIAGGLFHCLRKYLFLYSISSQRFEINVFLNSKKI